MFDIKDKVLLITGAAAGIGANVVEIFLEENIKHVTILDIDEINGITIEKELNTKYEGNKVKFIKCNVRQEHELLNAFNAVKNEQGYIDVVINNAMIANDKPFAKEIVIDVEALKEITKQARDFMRIDKGGRGGTIINVASLAGIADYPVFSVYSVSKAAVVKFSTALGNDFNHTKTGVRILTACFGMNDLQIAIDKTLTFGNNVAGAISSLLNSLEWQTPEETAQGLIQMYKWGTTGSIWVLSKGKAALDVTETYKQSVKMANDILA